MFRFAAYFNAVISLILAAFIYLNGRNRKENILASLLLLSVSLYAVFFSLSIYAPDPSISVIEVRIFHIFCCFLATFLYLFANEVLFADTFEKFWHFIPFLTTAVTSYFLLFGDVVNRVERVGTLPNWTVPGSQFYLYALHFGIFTTLPLILLFLRSFGLKGEKKQRAIFVLVAYLIGIGGGWTTFLPGWGIKVEPHGIHFIFLALFIIAYAILKHRLMDIEVVIKRGFVFSLLIAFVLAVYSFSLLALQTFFHGFGLGPWFAGVITAIAISLGFKPIESLLTDITDKYFFKKKYEYRKTLLELSKGLNQLMPLESFVRLLMRRIVRTVRLRGGAGLVFSETEGIFKTIAAERNMKDLEGQKFVLGDPLIAETAKGDYLLIDDIEETLRDTGIQLADKARLEALKGKMGRLNVYLAVPIRGENKIIGVVLLGAKLSEDAFSDEDLDLLVTLSAQAGMALTNVKVYDSALKEFQAEHDKSESLQKQLDRSQRLASLGTIAAGVAHEIRNPLTVIYSKAEKIANEERTLEYLKEFRDAVIKNADRITKIISSMLDLAKVKEKEMLPVNLNDVIKDALEFYTISKINLIEDFQQVSDVKGDREELKQLFINLISNAINSMPEGGELKISTYALQDNDHSFICADVSDTGVGIPKENLDKIFDPFFSTRHEGVGLGLSIVYRIVREHSGEINVVSEVGKGTKFTIRFPAAK